MAALGKLVLSTREIFIEGRKYCYDAEWTEGLVGLLTLAVGRLADFSSRCFTWTSAESS